MSGDVEQNPGPVNFNEFSASELKEVLQRSYEDDQNFVMPISREQIVHALEAEDDKTVNLAVGTQLRETSNIDPFHSINDDSTNSSQTPNDIVTTEKPETFTDVNDYTEINNKNLEDAIKVGSDALNQLGRANFESGIHFCPPHFVYHEFFSEEMALAYRNGNLENGPLRRFHGKIWEEVIYHVLMENLPHMLETTSIKCMWVFSGLLFAKNSHLLSQFSVNIIEETEVDFLVVGISKTSSLFLIPIEIKKAKSDGTAEMGKAKKQCKKYTDCMKQVLGKVCQSNDVERFIWPVIIRCHGKETSKEPAGILPNTRDEISWYRRDKLPKIFDFYFNSYDEFLYKAESDEETNLFSWIGHMDFENENTNCNSGEYQRLIQLLVFIFSCKVTKQNGHDVTNCFTHSQFGNKQLCVTGPMLCPKFVHKYVTENIDFLTYLKTFILKKGSGPPDLEAFHAYSVHKLPIELKQIVRKYLKNITNEQLDALMTENKRVVLKGDYGVGQTVVLTFKAMDILIQIMNDIVAGRIRFVSSKLGLELDVIPKFQTEFSDETLAKYVTFQSWEQFWGSGFIEDEFCFFDEAEDCRNVNNSGGNASYGYDHTNYKAISRTNPNKCRFIWFVAASTRHQTHFRRYSDLNDFVTYDLSWLLRNSHSIEYLQKIMFPNDPHNIDVTMNYPVYGARSRIHCYDPDNQEIMDSFVVEVKHWLSQINKGSILIFSSGVKYEDLKKKIADSKLDVKLEYLYDVTHCDSAPDIRLYFANEVIIGKMSGVEVDIIIADGHYKPRIYPYWGLLSRAKYGVSWYMGKNEVYVDRISKWGLGLTSRLQIFAQHLEQISDR